MSIGISAALSGELAEARAEIDRLRAENERLQEALSLLVESVEVGGWPSAAIVIAKAALAAGGDQ